MRLQLGIVGLLCLVAGSALGRSTRAGARGHQVVRQLDELSDMVRAGLAAQDHHVEALDRRMRDVEESTARAEREARLVSAQLGDVQAFLNMRWGDDLPDNDREPTGTSGSDSEVRDGS